MAKNTGDNYRNGSIIDKSQFQNPNTGLWQKRDRDNGQIQSVKTSNSEPYKGVAKEIDKRRK